MHLDIKIHCSKVANNLSPSVLWLLGSPAVLLLRLQDLLPEAIRAIRLWWGWEKLIILQSSCPSSWIEGRGCPHHSLQGLPVWSSATACGEQVVRMEGEERGPHPAEEEQTLLLSFCHSVLSPGEFLSRNLVLPSNSTPVVLMSRVVWLGWLFLKSSLISFGVLTVRTRLFLPHQLLHILSIDPSSFLWMRATIVVSKVCCW